MDLFKIITSLIPGGTALSVAAEVAKQVFGTDEPEAVKAAIDADPAKAAEFKEKLMAAENERLRAELADVQDARDTNVRLVQTGSTLAYAPAILSVMIVGAFIGINFAMIFAAVPDTTLTNMLYGQLAGMTGAVVQFWLGSSHGSRAKDAVIANSTPAQSIGSVVGGLIKRARVK